VHFYSGMAIVGDPSFQQAAANSHDPVAAEIAKRAQPIARSVESNKEHNYCNGVVHGAQ